MNEALEFLGYRSVHFPIIMQNTSALAKVKYRINRWAGEVGSTTPLFKDFATATDNRLEFRAPDISSFDALTDLPAARFYKELDKAFPNSKFILTIRDEEAWLRSCSKFFADGNHQFFKWIQLHFDIYGTNTFNEELFRKAYRQHIAEVKSYFVSRPDDLLIADIPKGDGWEKLCGFVGMGIPQNPFPNKNASRS